MGIENLVSQLNSLFNTDAANQINKFNKQARQQELSAIAGANARGVSSSGAFEKGMAETAGTNRSLGIGEILAEASRAKSAATSGAMINNFMSDKAFGQQKELMAIQRKQQNDDFLRDSLMGAVNIAFNPLSKAYGFNTYMGAIKPGMDMAKSYGMDVTNAFGTHGPQPDKAPR